MSCSGNCSSCGSDCQKQPLRHPNITGAILGQFNDGNGYAFNRKTLPEKSPRMSWMTWIARP